MQSPMYVLHMTVCMYVCVYVYVCMSVYVYVCVYVCMCVCINGDTVHTWCMLHVSPPPIYFQM